MRVERACLGECALVYKYAVYLSFVSYLLYEVFCFSTKQAILLQLILFVQSGKHPAVCGFFFESKHALLQDEIFATVISHSLFSVFLSVLSILCLCLSALLSCCVCLWVWVVCFVVLSLRQDIWLSEARSQLERADSQRDLLTTEIYKLKEEVKRNEVSYCTVLSNRSKVYYSIAGTGKKVVPCDMTSFVFLARSGPCNGLNRLNSRANQTIRMDTSRLACSRDIRHYHVYKVLSAPLTADDR